VEIGLNKRKKRKTGNGMLGNVKHVIIRNGPWCGMVQYSIIWYHSVWYNMIWYGMMWDVVWAGSVWYGMVL
jgi:hypothetical protein